MSYDLQVTKGREELQNYLLQNGGQKNDTGGVFFSNKTPQLAFWLSEDSLEIPYLLNHYNVNFVYEVLTNALDKLPNLEFTDSQLGKTFNSQNKGEITKEYVMECAINYAVVNTNMFKTNEGSGKETFSMATMRKAIPIEYDFVEMMSDDLYHLAQYKEAAKSREAYFSKPIPFVNLQSPSYKIVYVWTEFIDQIFPVKLPIDYIRFTWLNEAQTEVTKLVCYDYKALMALVPAPEEINDPIFGKRLLFKNILTKSPDIYKKLESLPGFPELPKEYVPDPDMTTLATTVVLPEVAPKT